MRGWNREPQNATNKEFNTINWDNAESPEMSSLVKWSDNLFPSRFLFHLCISLFIYFFLFVWCVPIEYWSNNMFFSGHNKPLNVKNVNPKAHFFSTLYIFYLYFLSTIEYKSIHPSKNNTQLVLRITNRMKQ